MIEQPCSVHSPSCKGYQEFENGAAHQPPVDPGLQRRQPVNPFLNSIPLLFWILLFVTGCQATFTSPSTSAPLQPSLSILGPSQLRAGDSTTFSAQMTGLQSESLTWSVNGIAGGNATVGTITTGGMYTAPMTAGSVTISYTISTFPSLSSSIALSILSPLPVISSAAVINSDNTGVIVDIDGKGFVSQSSVSVDGTIVSTAFLSDAELQASIPSVLSGASSIAVAVENPAPGAAESNSIEVTLPSSSLHQLDGCTNPNDPTVNVPTNAWGTSADTLYFPLTFYSTQLIGTPTYRSNTIFWISREDGPGDSVLMAGAFTGNSKTAKVALIPPGTVDWQSVVSETGTVVPTTQQGTTGLSFIVPPQFPAGVYGFEIDDPSAPTIFSLANDPSIKWAIGVPSGKDTSTALQSQVHDCGVEPGEFLRIFGKNFLSSSQVVLESSDGSVISVSPSRVDTNSIVAKIPSSLNPGQYYVWIGSAPWSATSSQAVPISVIPPLSRAVVRASCSALVGDGETDNTALLQACLDEDAPKTIPNTLVYLTIPSGVFVLGGGVSIHSGEILIGSSPSSTQFLGKAPDPQPNAWFTISQYSGIANLSIKAPNAIYLIAGSDLTGNPITSGHYFLKNLDIDSTPAGSNSNPGPMVNLAGPDIEVYESTFFSGTYVGLGIDFADGAVISGNTFINNTGLNYFNGSQNVVIEDNTVYSLAGPGSTANPNGNAAFDLTRAFCVYCQSEVTRNEYIGYNRMQNMGVAGTWNMQVIQMDGGAGVYYGPVATSTADTVVLADDPTWLWAGTGNLEGISVAIVLGTGAGQQSFIKAVSGRSITLVTPWKVNPDETSVVVITAAEQNLVIAHNIIDNTLGASIWISRSVDAVVEDNMLTNSGAGIVLAGFGPYGGPAAFPPIINTDVLRNKIAVGAGDLIVSSPNENSAGIGILDNYGIMISGLMIRHNVLPDIQTIYLTNGWDGLNATVVEENNADWAGVNFTVQGLLVQNNASP
jgi:hypothetical protein